MRIPEEDRYVHALQDMQATHTLDVFEVIQQPVLYRMMHYGKNLRKFKIPIVIYIFLSRNLCV